jgi:[ribosomal protein S5]-alanine N-acetyltransferase
MGDKSPDPTAGGCVIAPRLDLPLYTPRLLLRDFLPADLPAIHAYASDPEVTRFMFYGPRDEADSKAYLQRMLQSQVERARRTWELAVIRRADDRLIGACDVTLESAHEGDLGYIFARDAWGQGYASETARAMVDAGFVQLRLERIFATCAVEHRVSARVLEKAGLRRRTVLHRYKEAKGRWWDMGLYELTRADWQAATMNRLHTAYMDSR